jgi:hypothetical protein
VQYSASTFILYNINNILFIYKHISPFQY